MFEVGVDGVLQFTGAAVDAAAELFFGEQREPTLNQVEPRTTSGSEVEVEAGMAHEPALDGQGRVGAVII